MAGDSLYRPSQDEEGFKGFKKKFSCFLLTAALCGPFPCASRSRSDLEVQNQHRGKGCSPKQGSIQLCKAFEKHRSGALPCYKGFVRRCEPVQQEQMRLMQ